MKHSSFIRSGLAAMFLLGLGGCKGFLGDNISPNEPLTAPPAVLLSSIEANTAFTVGNEIGRVSDLLVQHYAGLINQPASYDVYLLQGNFNNEWQFNLYAGSLQDSRQLIDQTQATSPVYAGISKLLRAYNFALITDLWGDVPYSQANLQTGNLRPRFDKQEDIYRGNQALEIQSLFNLVRSGMRDLDQTTNVVRPLNDDLIYKGDLAKWRRFGNTLMLKMANTISVKQPDSARAIITRVLASGNFIQTNADDFEMPFGTTVGNTNPFYSYNITNRPDDQMASRRFLDSMNVRNDPRLPRYFTTTPSNAASITTAFGNFTGYQNGNNVAAPSRTQGNRSFYNTYVVGTSGEAPVRMVTNFQRLFIQAESALVLGTPGDPQALFQDAIRASMTKAGVAAADITAYFANPANAKWVTLSGTNEQKLNKIITQKWIAFIGNGYESYNDYRRTGYPRLALAVFPSSESPTAIPVRFPYPSSEVVANPNVPNPQPLTNVKVWWDAN